MESRLRSLRSVFVASLIQLPVVRQFIRAAEFHRSCSVSYPLVAYIRLGSDQANLYSSCYRFMRSAASAFVVHGTQFLHSPYVASKSKKK